MALELNFCLSHKLFYLSSCSSPFDLSYFTYSFVLISLLLETEGLWYPEYAECLPEIFVDKRVGKGASWGCLCGVSSDVCGELFSDKHNHV